MNTALKKTKWFEVDREGLADLVAEKGKVFVLHELLQNAWDCERVTSVDVSLRPVDGRSRATLVVVDDDPEGFRDLSHAYTLFAPSAKKHHPQQRGRFNLGEKLVLSLCDSARVESTSGTVLFDERGRRRSRKCSEAGTTFEASLRMTRAEYEDVVRQVRSVIPPAGVRTTFNGVEIFTPWPVARFGATLPTVVSGDDGALRTTSGTTEVRLIAPREGEVPFLYEMGIPVVELGGGEPWHVDVGQKIPLSMERDNVPPGYLQKLRALVLNHASSMLTAEQARAPWVLSAMASRLVEAGAVRTVVAQRFGEKAVIADPSDREGEHMAVAQGYAVVSGGTFPAEVWDAIRRAAALLPAGQVTPSPRPFSPGGEPLPRVPADDWTPALRGFARWATEIAKEVGKVDADVSFTLDRGWKFSAAHMGTAIVRREDGDFSPRSFLPHCEIVFNVGLLGERWFAPENWEKQLGLVVHELGHQWGQHLDSAYHEALCQLGAGAVRFALAHPELFPMGRSS